MSACTCSETRHADHELLMRQLPSRRHPRNDDHGTDLSDVRGCHMIIAAVLFAFLAIYAFAVAATWNESDRHWNPLR